MNATNRLFVATAALLASSTFATAQETNHNIDNTSLMKPRFDDSALQRIMPTRYGGKSRLWREQADADNDVATQADPLAQNKDSLNLPPVNMQGQVINTGGEGAPYTSAINRYPLAFAGWNSWALHPGLNVELGASVFAEFGKGAHSGAGFQQNIALMYAAPITDKLSIAVGGYLNNVNYAGGNWHDAGVSAVVGYRFNEHWEAYVYGQKSITNNIANRLRYSMYDGYYGGYYGGFGGPGFGGFGGFSRNFYGMPAYSVYDLSNMGDRIGATVRYNFNNNVSLEVSVENRWIPNR